MAEEVTNKHKLENCFVHEGTDFLPFEETLENNCYTLDCNLNHYYSILTTLKKISPVFNEYIFIITRNVDELPIKDRAKLGRTIVIVIGDEWNRAPKYSNKVAFVYKSPGQITKLAFQKNWLWFNILVLIQYIRIWFKRLPYQHKENVISIPLYGYRYLPMEIKPIQEREYDMSFMGSIFHNHNRKGAWIRQILKTPKILSRTKAIGTMEKLKDKYSIYHKATVFFPHSDRESEEKNYSEILMNTKICICPRGTNLETFRYFEGLRYGCIIIAEDQPDYEYLKESPAIILKSWDDLPGILSNLYKNKELMENLHKKGMEYFARECESNVLAEQISKDINKHYFSKLIFE
jgi:hypothetical protein